MAFFNALNKLFHKTDVLYFCSDKIHSIISKTHNISKTTFSDIPLFGQAPGQRRTLTVQLAATFDLRSKRQKHTFHFL